MFGNKKNKQVRTLPKLQSIKPILCVSQFMKEQEEKFEDPQAISEETQCAECCVGEAFKFKNKNLLLKPISRIKLTTLLKKGRVQDDKQTRPSLAPTQCQTVAQIKKQISEWSSVNCENSENSMSQKGRVRKGIFTVLKKEGELENDKLGIRV